MSGCVTGMQLANMYGFTTQNPSCIEVCSNAATTKQRKINIYGRRWIVYKPLVEITAENQAALQFLDMMTTIDKYSELSGDALREKLLKQWFENMEKLKFQLLSAKRQRQSRGIQKFSLHSPEICSIIRELTQFNGIIGNAHSFQ